MAAANHRATLKKYLFLAWIYTTFSSKANKVLDTYNSCEICSINMAKRSRHLSGVRK